MKRTSIIEVSIILLFLFGNASGVPLPLDPTIPSALGLQPPKAETFLTPSAQESAQGLISANQQSAYATSPRGFNSIATTPPFDQVIVPPGVSASNHLYASFAPQTAAGCNIYAKMPLWMEIEDSGDVWFYEWYENGHVEIDYAGYAHHPGWLKRWFFPNIPGWHILQFYCNGWSNFVYIYVHSAGNVKYWVSPPKTYCPTPLPYEPQLYNRQ